MIPSRLYLTIASDPDRGRGDPRDLLCTNILPAKGDRRVSVWWGGGRGEVWFSLKTGKAEKRAVPFRLSAKAAREVVRVLKAAGEELPDFLKVGWYGSSP
jgi:hypothetical protein